MNYYAFFGRPVLHVLDANKRGQIAPEQRDAIQRMAGAYRTRIAVMAVPAFAVAVFVLFLLWRVDQGDGTASPGLLAAGLCGVGLGLTGIVALSQLHDMPLLWAGGDLDEGRVESATGRVVWQHNRYAALVPARRLRMTSWAPGLPPGDYRFFYLPRTGLLMMAEALTGAPEAQPRDRLLDALAAANDFSINDLQANGQGLLSSRQQNRLLGRLVVSGLVLAGGVVMCGLAVYWLALGTGSAAWLVLMAAVGVFMAARSGGSALRLLGDLWAGQVKTLTGSVVRQHYRHRYTVSYYYAFDSLKFAVSKAAHDALIEGRPYRLYYAPQSKHLLAVEPL